MTRLLSTRFFLDILIVVYAFQPNCDPFNQFRFDCFHVQSCNQNGCFDQFCGEFTALDKLVRIKLAKVLPKCAFTNSENLEYIDGRNIGIEVLASGAFVNLTGNLQIELSFNSIRELHSGIFENVHAHTLDLSWNKLLYIQEGALLGLPKLKNLNLSRNELATFPMHELPLQLSVLDFSYNQIDRAILTSKRIPDLTSINLSYNVLRKIAVSLDNPVNSIDLSGNNLERFDLIELPLCEKLIIGHNLFRELPEPLIFLNLKKISLYPNPWHCDDLRQLWKKLQNNFVTLLETDKSKVRTNPLCTTNDNLFSTLEASLSRISKYCNNDADCDENLLCRASQCWNPCNYAICNTEENCEVNEHKPNCFCPNGTKLDSRFRYSECHAVECFTKSDCFLNEFCEVDKTCHNYSEISGNEGQLFSGNSSGNGGYGVGYGVSYGVSYGGGYGGSYGGGSGIQPISSNGFVNANGSGPIDGFPNLNDEWWRFEIPETIKEKKSDITVNI